MGNPLAISVGPGALFVAPMGTTLPASAVAVLDAAFVAVGYTDAGTKVNIAPSYDPIKVEEEVDPITHAMTDRETTVEFAMAEMTRTKLAIAVATFDTGVTDNTTAVDAPDPGTEKRVILVLKRANGALWLFRKCLQVGKVDISNRKGAEKATLPVSFKLEKPTTGALWTAYPTTGGYV